jgi:uncharacterized protein (DUF362 family)
VNGRTVEVKLPQILIDEVDCLVSLPVLKVHAMTQVSLSIKNLWGCYPDAMRCTHHSNLSEKLALITEKLKPKLALIDGTYTLDEHGPLYGTPRRTDLLLAADNPVVADALGISTMGMELARVKHVLMAEKYGLGTTDLSRVDIAHGWEELRMHCHVHRTFMDNLSTLLFRSDRLARVVMGSSFKPAIYGIAGRLRNGEEQKLVDDFEQHKV